MSTALERGSTAVGGVGGADGAGEGAGEGGHGRVYWAVADGWNVLRRGLTHYQRQPLAIVWQLGFPIISVLLYGYVFGSAMKVPGGGDYREFLMPGMFAMTMASGFTTTAAAVATDRTRGVIDRFRSMPMAPSAVVTGRGVGDLITACAELLILVATALLIGWSPNGGPLKTLAAIALLMLLRFSLIWLGVLLGLLTPSPEQAGGLYAAVFPITMISSVFVAPSLMPGWLGVVAAWNPVSSTVTATRELFGNPVAGGGTWPEEHALLLSIAWPALLTVVLLPLAVRRFQRLSR